MSKRAIGMVATVVAALVLQAQAAQAKTVVVGPASCSPGLQHYSTIQAAVNANQSIDQTNTINVCPGVYPEQVVITLPIIIKGINSGTGAASVITLPPAGLSTIVMAQAGDLTADGGTTRVIVPVAAQVVATNTFGVKLINLTIDGTLPEGSTPTCATGNRGAGILFQNIGDPSYNTFAGTIQQVVVRNQHDGCNTAEGVVMENAFMSITGSDIHDIDRNGILQVGGDTAITSNTLQICNASAIAVTGTTGIVVSQNVMSNNQYGVRLDGTTDVTVTTNTIGPWVGTGIYVVNGALTGITSNKINSAWAGIWVTQSSGSIVRLNSIVRSAQFAIGFTFSKGDNTFSNNTLNEAKFGIYEFNPAAVTLPDTVLQNTFLNITTTTTNNPF